MFDKFNDGVRQVEVYVVKWSNLSPSGSRAQEKNFNKQLWSFSYLKRDIYLRGVFYPKGAYFYHHEFLVPSTGIGAMSTYKEIQKALIRTFVAGLKGEIAEEIQMFKPKSLKETNDLLRMWW